MEKIVNYLPSLEGDFVKNFKTPEGELVKIDLNILNKQDLQDIENRSPSMRDEARTAKIRRHFTEAMGSVDAKVILVDCSILDPIEAEKYWDLSYTLYNAVNMIFDKQIKFREEGNDLFFVSARSTVEFDNFFKLISGENNAAAKSISSKSPPDFIAYLNNPEIHLLMLYLDQYGQSEKEAHKYFAESMEYGANDIIIKSSLAELINMVKEIKSGSNKSNLGNDLNKTDPNSNVDHTPSPDKSSELVEERKDTLSDSLQKNDNKKNWFERKMEKMDKRLNKNVKSSDTTANQTISPEEQAKMRRIKESHLNFQQQSQLA